MVIVAAVFAGALVQGTTGFGFALLAAPIMVAAVGPHEAVGAVLVLGVVLNAATLLTAGRAAHPLPQTTARLAAYAVPGIALGAVALAALPERLLSAAVCLAVLAGVATRLVPVGEPRERRRRWALPAAGLAAGALTTSTGTNGPPLVLYLLHRRATPAQVRDTLAALFLLLSAAGALLLLASDGLELPAATAALVAAALVGHEAGRRLFARLDARRHERAILAVLTLTAAASGAAAVL